MELVLIWLIIAISVYIGYDWGHNKAEKETLENFVNPANDGVSYHSLNVDGEEYDVWSTTIRIHRNNDILLKKNDTTNN